MAKTITYDAPSNTISADGGTSDDRITLENIYQADLAGGWGVFFKHGEGAYSTTANVWVGHNSATYFRILREGLLSSADDNISPFSAGANGDCYFRWGVLASTDGFMAAGSSNFLFDGGLDARHFCFRPFYRTYDEGAVELRSPSCTLQDCQIQGKLRCRYTAHKIIRCVTRGHIDPDTNIHGDSENNIFGSVYSTSPSPRSLRDCLVIGLVRVNRGIFSITNPWQPLSMVEISHSSGEIRENFTFAPIWQYVSGDPVGGATIIVQDKDGNEVANYETNVSGLPDVVPEIRVRMWAGTEETETDYNPFTVTASKAGYQTYTAVITIDNPQEDPITLLDWSECPAEADVEAGVSYAEGTRTGIFVGSSHYAEAEILTPALEVEILTPALSVEITS